MFGFRRKQKVPTVAVVPQPFYHMQETQQPTAGAPAYAFVPHRLLPPQPLITGTPFPSRAVLPGAPLWATNYSLQYGLGGTVAGQLVHQPLVSNPNTGGTL